MPVTQRDLEAAAREYADVAAGAPRPGPPRARARRPHRLAGPRRPGARGERPAGRAHRDRLPGPPADDPHLPGARRRPPHRLAGHRRGEARGAGEAARRRRLDPGRPGRERRRCSSSPTRPRRGTWRRDGGAGPDFETILYGESDAVATITLNRPESLNTIVPPMPDEVEAAVERAIADPEVKVIVVRGAGRAFCAGYDFGGGFHHWDECAGHRRRVGPGQGLRRRHRARARADPEADERLAGAEAGDRPGPRLVRRGRQRLRALRRPGDRQRGRPHRHALLADVGRLPVGHVDLPARPDQGEGARADRKAAVGRRSGRGRG